MSCSWTFEFYDDRLKPRPLGAVRLRVSLSDVWTGGSESICTTMTRGSFLTDDEACSARRQMTRSGDPDQTETVRVHVLTFPLRGLKLLTIRNRKNSKLSSDTNRSPKSRWPPCLHFLPLRSEGGATRWVQLPHWLEFRADVTFKFQLEVGKARWHQTGE